jgi:PAS domain S-box-containing protein
MRSDIAHRRAELEPRPGLVPLEEILCTDEIRRRPLRAPDFETESRALGHLLDALAQSPRTIFQSLADTLLEVFKADSAGLSLLTDDGQDFRWVAIAGAWSPHRGGGTPRDFGPCRDVLDCGRPLLFKHWERRYPLLAEATPLAEEGLLVPLYVGGKAAGAIWMIAHSPDRRFDAEDLRQLESMGRFASAAYQTVRLLTAHKAGSAALENMEAASRSKQMLETIIETTPDTIVVIDTDCKILQMNAAGREMVGATSRSEIEHASALDTIAPEFWDVWKEHHRRVCRGEKLAWEFDVVGLNGVRHHMETHSSPIRLPNGTTGRLAVSRDITERKEAERQQKLLMDELNHRVKNTLATVQSLIAQTARGARDVSEFRAAVEGRILALSQAHNQLSRRGWLDAELGQLLRSGLEPYFAKGNVVLAGEPLQIPPRVALMVSMAIHELATNAAKYGALSSSAGRIDVAWCAQANGAGSRLLLSWLEQNGPPVRRPSHRGFGTQLLDRGIRMELGGSTLIDFAPEGVRCELDIPLSNDGE